MPAIDLGAIDGLGGRIDGDQPPALTVSSSPAVPGLDGLDGVALSRLTASSRVEGDRLANPSEGG